jgi:hypothetical protein
MAKAVVTAQRYELFERREAQAGGTGQVVHPEQMELLPPDGSAWRVVSVQPDPQRQAQLLILWETLE